MPVSALSAVAASATVRVIGPAASWDLATPSTPAVETRPTLGFSATTPATPAHVQRVQFCAAQLIQRALLIDVSSLRRQPGGRGVAGDCGPLIFQLNADAQLLGLYFRKLRGYVGANPLFVEFVVYVMLQLGLLVIAADRSGLGFLVHQFASYLDFQVFVVGLGAFELVFGVQRVALQRGIAQFQNDAVGFHDGARAQDNPVHARIRLCRDPADVFRNECAEATNFAKHGPPFYLVGPNRSAVDGRSGRAQTRKPESDTSDEQNGDGGVQDASNFLSVSVRWALNVHDLIYLGKASCGPEQPPAKGGKMNNLGEHASRHCRNHGENGIRRPTSEQPVLPVWLVRVNQVT